MFALYRGDLDPEIVAAAAGVSDVRCLTATQPAFLQGCGFGPCGFIGAPGGQCPHGDPLSDIRTAVETTGWILLDERVGVDFVTPILDLVNQEVDRRIAAGVVIDGLLFKASASDETRTLKLAQNAAFALMGAPVLAFPMSVPSDTFTGGIQQMLVLNTPMEAIEFAGALLMNSESEREAARTVKDAVRQAATEDAAMAIFDAWRAS